MGARGSRRDPPAVRDGGGMSAPPRGRYHPLGIRLDSGDLATLSKQARAAFSAALERYGHTGVADVLTIVASNDISEESLVKLNAQGHSIDTFGIGTHLVTCQAQPALGCVYKLVECGGTPRIKLSQELAKAPPARRPRTARAPPALTPRGPQVSVPGRKQLFRLLDAQGCAVADIMLNDAEVHSLPACLPAGAPDPPDPPWGRQRLARLSARAAAVGGCEGESQSGGRNPVLPPPGGVAAGGARGRAGGAAVHVCVGLRAAHGAAANSR